MEYAAAVLAVIGFATGLWLRLRHLLAILAGLLLLSLFYSIRSRFGFLDTALTIMVVQTIAQGGYFLGLVARAFLTANGVRHIL